MFNGTDDRVNLGATSKFKLVENANYAVNIGKDFGFSMVNIGGVDIVDKKKKLILAIIWQLMRMYVCLRFMISLLVIFN
jgi:plastin-1